jgi:hypothetical protein
MNITMEHSTQAILDSFNNKLVLGVTTAIFIGIALSLQARNRADRFLHIPAVGKKGWESSRRREFMSNAAKLYAEGYHEVKIVFFARRVENRVDHGKQHKDGIFRITTARGEFPDCAFRPVFAHQDRIAMHRHRA